MADDISNDLDAKTREERLDLLKQYEAAAEGAGREKLLHRLVATVGLEEQPAARGRLLEWLDDMALDDEAAPAEWSLADGPLAEYPTFDLPFLQRVEIWPLALVWALELAVEQGRARAQAKLARPS